VPPFGGPWSFYTHHAPMETCNSESKIQKRAGKASFAASFFHPAAPTRHGMALCFTKVLEAQSVVVVVSVVYHRCVSCPLPYHVAASLAPPCSYSLANQRKTTSASPTKEAESPFEVEADLGNSKGTHTHAHRHV